MDPSQEERGEVTDLRDQVRTLEQAIVALEARLVDTASEIATKRKDSFADAWDEDDEESSSRFFDSAYVDDRARKWLVKEDKRKSK